MSEEFTSTIKKEVLSKARSATIQSSASLIATQSDSEESAIPLEAKGMRSESPINLTYGRVFQGDGEKLELILIHCYQCLIDASDKPSIVKVCTWFQTQKQLKITFSAPQFAGLVPAKLSFTPTYTFNQENLLPVLKEVPDIKVPSSIKAIANDYSRKKGTWPVKLACLQVISTLTDQIYSNVENVNIVKRKEQLKQLETFVRQLQDKTEFAFLKQGKRFKSFLENSHQLLCSGLEEIDKITQKPLQIDKWLAAYYLHATELVNQLIPYSDHLLQDIEISESSHQVLTTTVYEIYRNIAKKSTTISLSLDRAKAIHSVLERTIAIIQKEGLGNQPLSLTSLKELVAAKKLTLVEAGFYYDYILNSPDSWQALSNVLSGKAPYHLTADQFLRELIYGFRELKAYKNDEVLKAALMMYKHKTGDSAEYGLAMLRCRVLNPKNLLDEALHLKQQSQQQDKATLYLNLAKQAFNPILIDLATDTEKHIAIWRPGIIATFENLAGFNPSTGGIKHYLPYAKTVLSLVSIYPQLSAYVWFTKSLEWATRGMGNDTIVVIYRDFLQSLSQHTLQTILPIISHVLLEMDASNKSSLRNRLRAEAKEYKAHESIQHWQHQQASIEQKPFYRDLLRSLWMLKNICKGLDKYVCDANILAGIKENQNLAEMLILACDSTDKSLPDAKQQMTSAKLFFDDIHAKLHKLLNHNKEEKDASPVLEQEKITAEPTTPSLPATPLNTPPASPAKPKPSVSPLLDRPETPSDKESITDAATPPKEDKDNTIKKLNGYLSDDLYEIISLPILVQEFLSQAEQIVADLTSQSLVKSRTYYEKIGKILSKISTKISDTDKHLQTIKAKVIAIKKDLLDEINLIFLSQLQGQEDPDAQSLRLHELNQALIGQLQAALAQVVAVNRRAYNQFSPSSSFNSSITASQSSVPSIQRAPTKSSGSVFTGQQNTKIQLPSSQKEQYLYLPSAEGHISPSASFTTTSSATKNPVEDLADEHEGNNSCVIS